MIRICRTCLQVIENSNFIKFNDLGPTSDSVSVLCKVMFCVPEMVTDLVPDSVICITCSAALHLAYKFRRKCLHTEERIRSYMEHVGYQSKNVDLSKVVDKDIDYVEPELVHVETVDLNTSEENGVEMDIPTNIVVRENSGFRSSQNVNSWENNAHQNSIQLTEFPIYRDLSEKPFKCQMCSKGFDTKSHLVAHMRTHTGEKPYSCGLCEKRFTEKSSLNRHMRSHTGVKPYKCEYCEKSFSDKSTLVVHVRNHTGEKPFSCNLCEKRFNDKRKLNMHNKAHTTGVVEETLT